MVMNGYKEWHSKLQTSVYHNNTDCKVGDNIQPENVLPGRGGKKLCDTCKNLNSKRR